MSPSGSPLTKEATVRKTSSDVEPSNAENGNDFEACAGRGGGKLAEGGRKEPKHTGHIDILGYGESEDGELFVELKFKHQEAWRLELLPVTDVDAKAKAFSPSKASAWSGAAATFSPCPRGNGIIMKTPAPAMRFCFPSTIGRR